MDPLVYVLQSNTCMSTGHIGSQRHTNMFLKPKGKCRGVKCRDYYYEAKHTGGKAINGFQRQAKVSIKPQDKSRELQTRPLSAAKLEHAMYMFTKAKVTNSESHKANVLYYI